MRNNANQERFALFRITARSFALFRMKDKADEYTPVGAEMRKKANLCEPGRVRALSQIGAFFRIVSH